MANLINKRQIDILEKFPEEKSLASSDVLKVLEQKISLVTIKRDLEDLVKLKYLERKGKGRSTVYEKTNLGILLSPVDASKYNEIDPDLRNGRSSFNFCLFDKFPHNVFLNEENETLDNATKNYQKNIKEITPTVQSKELERFIIELSWKSSKIEGNTYTLLDTERLIREGVPSEGNTKNETTMILNHKKAFSFIMENLGNLSKNGINQNFVEKVHELLTLDLDVSRGVRSGLVGIIGTKYKPLDNKYQINEALESLYKAINKMNDVYSKALTLLVGISYIQPFEDGNKRTVRLLCNAILLASQCAPLSYRSVDENNYRESILVFYEKNSLEPMKKIFIDQYIFSTQNYLIK
jgi:Fic family protein